MPIILILSNNKIIINQFLPKNMHKNIQNRLKYLILLLIPIFLFSACSKQSEETLFTNAQAKIEEAKKEKEEENNSNIKKLN